MAKNIELITKYQKAVDDQFSAESKRNLVTNNNYKWTNANSIKIYKVSTSQINDYIRDSKLPEGQWSHYGKVEPLEAITQTLTLTQDKSFTFMLDRMDVEETGEALAVTEALARQNREVVIPMYDKYVYSKIVEGAGTESSPATIDKTNIYDLILEANAVLDENMVPEIGRILLISPNYYKHLKGSKEIAMNTDIGQEMRLKGVVGVIDGVQVVKVPANRLPDDVAFILCHPIATVAPVKLEDYVIHDNPQGLNGYLVEGRMYYDAFVLDNKKNAIYVQKTDQ